MTQEVRDLQALAKRYSQREIPQLELEQYLEQQSEEIAPEIDGDNVVDEDFYNLYR